MMDDMPPAADPETSRPIALGAGRRRAALAFIFVTVLIDVMSIGIIIPVYPQLVKGFLEAQGIQGANAFAVAAETVGWFSAAWAVMQFFSSPIIGMLSDRFGRRPVILLSNFGLGCDFVLMALAPSIAWLFVGRIISGITAASFSTANAYVADITPPDKRAAGFGLMSAAFGAGFVLGPFLGGVLGHMDPRLPFWIAAGLSMTNWLYGFFILPESLARESRAPRFNWAKANPIGSFKLLSSHPELLGLATIVFLYQLAHQVLQSTFVLYTGYVFDWGPWELGWYLGGVGVSSIIVQAVLVRMLAKPLGDRGLLLAGCFFGILGFIGYAAAPTPFWFWAALPVFALMGLLQPGLMGLMSRRVLPNEQGQLQGANSGIMAIAGVIGPPLFTHVFGKSIQGIGGYIIPGAAVYLAAAMIILAFFLALWFGKKAKAAEAMETSIAS